MIIKITPDKQKSKSLIEAGKISLKRLNEFDIYKYPSNSITDYYDIIHKFMDALALENGIKIKGEGAHQELIDFICKKYKFSEGDRIFLQELRDYRNRIAYEGFMLNKAYLENNICRINKIIDVLGKLLNITPSH